MEKTGLSTLHFEEIDFFHAAEAQLRELNNSKACIRSIEKGPESIRMKLEIEQYKTRLSWAILLTKNGIDATPIDGWYYLTLVSTTRYSNSFAR